MPLAHIIVVLLSSFVVTILALVIDGSATGVVQGSTAGKCFAATRVAIGVGALLNFGKKVIDGIPNTVERTKQLFREHLG